MPSYLRVIRSTFIPERRSCWEAGRVSWGGNGAEKHQSLPPVACSPCYGKVCQRRIFEFYRARLFKIMAWVLTWALGLVMACLWGLFDLVRGPCTHGFTQFGPSRLPKKGGSADWAGQFSRPRTSWLAVDIPLERPQQALSDGLGQPCRTADVRAPVLDFTVTFHLTTRFIYTTRTGSVTLAVEPALKLKSSTFLINSVLVVI